MVFISYLLGRFIKRLHLIDQSDTLSDYVPSDDGLSDGYFDEDEDIEDEIKNLSCLKMKCYQKTVLIHLSLLIKAQQVWLGSIYYMSVVSI